MANILPASCVVIALLGVALLIASAATNYWREYTVLRIKTSEGLFRRCTKSKDFEVCRKLFNDFGDLPAKFAGVVALMIMAIIFECLSIIVKVADMMMEKKLNGVVAVLQAFAVIFGVAGLSVYDKHYIGGNVDAGWSYIIGWVGVSLLGIGLIFVLILISRR